MKIKSKRLVSALLTLVMAFCLLAAMSLTAHAAPTCEPCVITQIPPEILYQRPVMPTEIVINPIKFISGDQLISLR